MLDLSKNPTIYVTRDIERAIGIDLDTPGYFIISNYTDFGNKIAENKDNILLIKGKKMLDTWEILQWLVNPELHEVNEGSFEAFKKCLTKYLSDTKKNDFERSFAFVQDKLQIIVFKPTKQIERICAENNWNLLNPSAELSNKIEEKISQLDWLGSLKKYLPEHGVKLCKDLEYKNEPYILQFNRAHTGTGTILIESEKQLEEIKNKFPNREARITKYIEGPIFTNNNVVTKNKILIGNINYQITGLEPFTDNKFATIGNDWGFPKKYLNEKQIEEYKKIITDIGEKLKQDGWKGLFGVDVVIDKSSGKLYLIEINARQPASTTYESKLQANIRIANDTNLRITTYKAHLMSLLDMNLEDKELIEIKDGAQIIQRITKQFSELPEPKIQGEIDFQYIKYNNKKSGSDLLRLQTTETIIEEHTKLNMRGLILMTFIFVVNYGSIWNSPRGSVLFIKNNKILLLKRYKYGVDYYEIPGGTQEDGENIKETAVREGKEETNLDFELNEKKSFFVKNQGRDEYYFFAKNISDDKPKLIGEEAEFQSDKNSFEFEWLELSKLKNIKLMPIGLAEEILKRIN